VVPTEICAVAKLVDPVPPPDEPVESTRSRPDEGSTNSSRSSSEASLVIANSDVTLFVSRLARSLAIMVKAAQLDCYRLTSVNIDR